MSVVSLQAAFKSGRPFSFRSPGRGARSTGVESRLPCQTDGQRGGAGWSGGDVRRDGNQLARARPDATGERRAGGARHAKSSMPRPRGTGGGGGRPMPFLAHAWVEVEGRVVNDWPRVRQFYPPLGAY